MKNKLLTVCALAMFSTLGFACASETDEVSGSEQYLASYDRLVSGKITHQQFVRDHEAFMAFVNQSKPEVQEELLGRVELGMLERGVQSAASTMSTPHDAFALQSRDRLVAYADFATCDEYWSDAFFLCEEVYDRWYETVQRGACRIAATAGWSACVGLAAFK